MVNQNYQKLKIFSGFFPLFFLLFSCASTPTTEKFYKGRSGFGLMAEGASLYITADVQSVRPIVDALVLGGLSGSEIKQFLDMTDILTAAIFNSPGERHFYAAAAGNFPSGRVGYFFSTNKDWEKKVSASGLSYWHSARSGLSASISANKAYLSDRDPFVNAPGARVPEALPPMQKDSVLSGWMNNPSPAINRLIAALEVPIEIPAELLLFAVYREDDVKTAKSKKAEEQKYTALLRFETRASAQAAGLVTIFTMARMGIALADFSERREMEALAKAFFSRNPRQDGNALIIQTGTMNGKDLALLFNAISVY